MSYTQSTIKKLNADILNNFHHIFPIEEHFKLTHAGVSRLVMLDRYSQKDRSLKTLGVTDIVVTIVKEDPKFPSRGIGQVIDVDYEHEYVTLKLEEEFRASLENEVEASTGIITRPFKQVDKPLEIYYEQIAKRVGKSLASTELSDDYREGFGKVFAEELAEMNVIPAGRVLYGAGSQTQVTYFNCFVMPFIHDSRGGISNHRKEVMEIMSRGGGVGTNGSTLRPKAAPAKGVGGKSSGAVSWLNDIANLTHLVEQGGSRRGAQMIMLADWHPDIIEFIISKMQNPKVLKWLIENSKDEQIKYEAEKKIKFTALSRIDKEIYESLTDNKNIPVHIADYAREQLANGGSLRHLNDLCDDSDLGWVENKLAAVSHVLPPPSGTDPHHPACEYALATRLILEEQALDQNQSTGKSGKYARRFHPREELPLSKGSSGDFGSEGDGDRDARGNAASAPSKTDRPAVSTRPLTVGEVAANWRDSIRETLQVRYHCNLKDPLPVLDATIQELLLKRQVRVESTSPERPSTPLPQLFPETKFALSNTVRKVLIQTRFRSDFDSLVQSLGHTGTNKGGIRFQTASDIEEALSRNDNLGVVVLRQDGPTPSSANRDTIRRVLESEAHCPVGTTVICIDSSWHRLQESVELFGDFIPRRGTNRAKCVVPGRFLSLCLAEWPGTVHPEESKNAAILNPWTGALSCQEAENLLVPPWSGSTFQ